VEEARTNHNRGETMYSDFDFIFSDKQEVEGLVEGFTPTLDELRVLVEHYIDIIQGDHYTWKFHAQTSDSNRRLLAVDRLDTIKAAVGEREFDA
jgi:hypothetical protein